MILQKLKPVLNCLRSSSVLFITLARRHGITFLFDKQKTILYKVSGSRIKTFVSEVEKENVSEYILTSGKLDLKAVHVWAIYECIDCKSYVIYPRVEINVFCIDHVDLIDVYNLLYICVLLSNIGVPQVKISMLYSPIISKFLVFKWPFNRILTFNMVFLACTNIWVLFRKWYRKYILVGKHVSMNLLMMILLD